MSGIVFNEKRFWTILKEKYGISFSFFKLLLKQYILDGYIDNKIYELICEEFPEFKKYSLTSLVYHTKTIKEELSKELEDVVIETIYFKNLSTYEQVYQYFKSVGHNVGMRKAILMRNQLLEIVEPPGTDIEVNNISIHEQFEFDFSKLTEAERLELDQLVERCQ